MACPKWSLINGCVKGCANATLRIFGAAVLVVALERAGLLGVLKLDLLDTASLSGYQAFPVDEWLNGCVSSPLDWGLTEHQVTEGIRLIETEGLFPNGPDVREIHRIYWPFAMMLAERVREYLDERAGDPNACYVLGLSGSVSVGKTTAARVLRTLLSWCVGRVEVVATDHFLLPNETLQARGIMRRKGFPESYDDDAIRAFVTALRRGDETLVTPVYDHVAYTRLPDREKVIPRPKCLILEGVSALQRPEWQLDGRLYFQADPDSLWRWYLARFMEFRRRASDRPNAFFYRYAQMTEAEAHSVARDFWHNINWVNMMDHIEPSREGADWILEKGADHRVQRILIRSDDSVC